MKLLPISHASNRKDSSHRLTLAAPQTNHSHNAGTVCPYNWLRAFVFVLTHMFINLIRVIIPCNMSVQMKSNCTFASLMHKSSVCLNTHIVFDSDAVTFEVVSSFSKLFFYFPLLHAMLQYTLSLRGLGKKRQSIPFP